MKTLKLDKLLDQTSLISIDRSIFDPNSQEKKLSPTSHFRKTKVVPDFNIDSSNDYSKTSRIFQDKDFQKNSQENTHNFLNSKKMAPVKGISFEKLDPNRISFSKLEKKRISFVNFTESFGKITKNAVHDLKGTVRQDDFKEEYRKGLEKAFNFLDINSSKNPLLKFIKTFIFFNLQLLIFIMNFVSIVNLILTSDYRLGDFDEKIEPSLKGIELSLGFFFSIEIVLEIFFNYSGFFSIIRILFSMGNIIDMLLTMEIIYSNFYAEDFKKRIWIFVIIGFLRSLKLIKLRKIIEFNLKELRKIFENRRIELFSNDEEDIKFSVITSVCDVLVGIFIEATALLTLNEILDHEAFTNPKTFTYIGACYYAIVSLTTIGYGDNTPMKLESRLFVSIMLLFNISVLSNFLANLTDRIGKLSPFVRNFSFTGHVVIIGDIPISFLQFFIEEINENDAVNERLKVEKKERIKFIIIGKDDPSRELEHWICQFSANEKNGEAEYLKSNIMESKWFKQSNLQYCKHLFAFSINMQESEASAFENDKLLAFNVQNIIEVFPKLPITLTLNSDYDANIKKDSLWKNVQTVPFRLLNDFIMANSLENQGFNTWLAHLLTLREKKKLILREENEESLMGDYAENMKQEIYPISKEYYRFFFFNEKKSYFYFISLLIFLELPDFFIGKTFIEATRIIYFSSVDFIDSFLTKPNGELRRNDLNSNKHESGLQMIAIQLNSYENSSKILINPINHIISKDEIGYVIALDQKNSEKISSFLSNDSPSYISYLRNMNFMKKLSKSKGQIDEKKHELIEGLFRNFSTNCNNWKIDEERWKNNGFVPIKSIQVFDEKKEKIPSYFNLFQDNSPKGLFKNHLIIKGNLTEVSNIAYIIRFYSQRPIVFFTEHRINHGIWTKLKASFSNVFCVIGNPMLVKHVEQLDPKKAYKILLLTSSKDELIQDSSNVIFTRILADFFELSNFLVELLDENNMKFMSAKPSITFNNELDFFYWPYFVRGSVHFSSLIMSILARALYNKNWINFLKNLSQPEHKEEENQSSSLENSSIMTLEITKELVESIHFYGELQYMLMMNEPAIMAIALLKEKAYMKKSSKKRMTAFSLDGGTQNRLKAMIATHLIKTMDDLYNYSYLMTNPSFLTNLEVGNKVLVLATLPRQNHNNMALMRLKEMKSIPKIKVYLNRSSIDRENLKKEEERKRIVRFFRERKKIWRTNERRMDFKEKLSSLLGEANGMIRFTLENYRNVFDDNE